MTGPCFSASIVEGSELGWVARDRQLGETPATLRVNMGLCVGRYLRLSTWIDGLTTRGL
jgi:hypothetical protein